MEENKKIIASSTQHSFLISPAQTPITIESIIEASIATLSLMVIPTELLLSLPTNLPCFLPSPLHKQGLQTSQLQHLLFLSIPPVPGFNVLSI